MLLNDIQDDLARICAHKGMSKSRLASQMGVTRQALCGYRSVTPVYISLMERLGYDIEINYVKRLENGKK